jgi:hypothetical protein
MATMLSANNIRTRLREQPFTLLRFVMSSGQSYDVHHPDMVLVAKNFLIIGLPSGDDPSEAGEVTRVGILHITEMKDIPRPASQPNANGPPA